MSKIINDPRLILLSSKDNVLVVVKIIDSGEEISVSGKTIKCEKTLSLGHKIALKNIAKGDKVFKYGAPIGSATSAIEQGQHVHVHNIESDYTKTNYLKDGGA